MLQEVSLALDFEGPTLTAEVSFSILPEASS